MFSFTTQETIGRLRDLGRILANNGLILGPLLAVTTYGSLSSSLTHAQAAVAAIAVLMGLWWITEALPLAVTALLPIATFPLLGIVPMAEATKPYAHPLIFLFLGGFLLALAMQRWQLHRRIALAILRQSGTSAASIIGGFMGGTAFLSMWVSNTATALMMLPIGLSVIELFRRQEVGEDSTTLALEKNFSTALLLGIAYGANIGGVGTLIGSPPNALLAAFLREAGGVQISFASWLLIGLPTVGLMLPLTWLLLTRVLYPLHGHEVRSGKSLIAAEIRALGPMGREEKLVAGVFVLTALLWILQPLITRLIPALKLDDTMIAMLAVLLLFILPSDWKKRQFLLDWDYACKLPWGLLLLFGGGLSLAGAIQESGLSRLMGDALHKGADFPPWLIVLGITGVMIALTEVTSNTATAATFLPIILSLAVTIGQPVLLLAVPAVLASSFAFMLPVATPPNAVVYAGGQLQIKDMVRAGLWLNIVGTLVITFIAMTIARSMAAP